MKQLIKKVVYLYTLLTIILLVVMSAGCAVQTKANLQQQSMMERLLEARRYDQIIHQHNDSILANAIRKLTIQAINWSEPDSTGKQHPRQTVTARLDEGLQFNKGQFSRTDSVAEVLRQLSKKENKHTEAAADLNAEPRIIPQRYWWWFLIIGGVIAAILWWIIRRRNKKRSITSSFRLF